MPLVVAAKAGVKLPDTPDAGALNEFNTFVDCSAPRNTAEPAELVNRKAERGKNLKIESGEWLSRCSGDL